MTNMRDARPTTMTAMIHSLTPPVTILSLVLVKTVCRTTRKRDKKVIADEGEPDEKRHQTC